mgnify:CR=1 FL=1
MANHKGSEGTVKIGTDVIAEVRNWSIDESAETIDDTVLGDTAKTKKAGLTEWSGSLECFWDETDANGQGAMTIGAEVTLNLYPEGDTSGDTYFSGSAIITAIGAKGSHDGMVEASFGCEGNGALTKPTVT